jgi:hypothetical protein
VEVAIACEVRKSKAKLEERKIINTVILDSISHDIPI